jgi:hypothetical protein
MELEGKDGVGETVEGMEGDGTTPPPPSRDQYPSLYLTRDKKGKRGLQLCVSLREDCMHPRGLPVCPPVVS